MLSGLRQEESRLQGLQAALPVALQHRMARTQERLERARLRLGLLDPRLVLQRGYAWLAQRDGAAITSVAQAIPGQAVRATLADGELDLTVRAQRLGPDGAEPAPRGG
jgi:exodeoxyribonuclease VII large subunit